MKIKKHFIIYIVIMVLVVAGAVYFTSTKQGEQGEVSSSVCQTKKITFYYLKTCEWCNKVKEEGAIEQIENLGIKVNKIDAAVGPVRHKFQAVPAFAINGKVYEGYRTFEDLRELLGCPNKSNDKAQNSANQN